MKRYIILALITLAIHIPLLGMFTNIKKMIKEKSYKEYAADLDVFVEKLDPDLFPFSCAVADHCQKYWYTHEEDYRPLKDAARNRMELLCKSLNLQDPQQAFQQTKDNANLAVDAPHAGVVLDALASMYRNTCWKTTCHYRPTDHFIEWLKTNKINDTKETQKEYEEFMHNKQKDSIKYTAASFAFLAGSIAFLSKSIHSYNLYDTKSSLAKLFIAGSATLGTSLATLYTCGKTWLYYSEKTTTKKRIENNNKREYLRLVLNAYKEKIMEEPTVRLQS